VDDKIHKIIMMINDPAALEGWQHLLVPQKMQKESEHLGVATEQIVVQVSVRRDGGRLRLD
jgi:hypothetical protein